MNIEAGSADSIEQHLRNIDAREAQIVELLRKLAMGVLELNRKISEGAARTGDDPLDEYDFVYLVSNGQGRWVWKHFLRGTRSARQFPSREDAVADARRDAALSIRTRGLIGKS